MNNVGAIGAGYTQGIQPRQNNENPKQDVQQELQPKQKEANQSNMNPDAVMEFLAASADVKVTPKSVSNKKTIRISDYVTPEQAKRIAGFVTGFEQEVAQGLNGINEEFPEMPDSMALVIALAAFEDNNY